MLYWYVVDRNNTERVLHVSEITIQRCIEEGLVVRYMQISEEEATLLESEINEGKTHTTNKEDHYEDQLCVPTNTYQHTGCVNQE